MPSPARPADESSEQLVDPPGSLVPGSAEDSQQALQNVKAKERASRRPFFSSRRAVSTTSVRSAEDRATLASPSSVDGDEERYFTLSQTGTSPSLIQVADPSALETRKDIDLYRWAVLYENQRGMILLSTPYYSRQSLLPTDPPPFTIPSSGPSPREKKFFRSNKAHQPNVSLTDYPLPDGDWLWISKEWMVDMRGEGMVQHDGFEYNWLFKKGGWQPKASRFNGWVRRRRWVRLMMRPAVDGKVDTGLREGMVTHADVASSNSVAYPSARSGEVIELDSIWRGDEGDWERCHQALKSLDRDGRKLELWRDWLGEDAENQGKLRKQWTEDEGLMPSEARRNEAGNRGSHRPAKAERSQIIAVLRLHGNDIIRSFIYSTSRAEFLRLLAKAGIRNELPAPLATSSVAFWSQQQELDEISSDDGKETGASKSA